MNKEKSIDLTRDEGNDQCAVIVYHPNSQKAHGAGELIVLA